MNAISVCIKAEVESNDGTPDQQITNNYNINGTKTKIASLVEVLVPRPSPSSMNDDRNVVIVMDALREFSWQPLLWTLKHVLRSGCSVTLLGVMPWIPFALLKGRNEFKSDPKYQKIRGIIELCERKGVVPYVKVAMGHPLKLVVLEKTTNLHASLVVLDRHMRKNKSFFKERIPSSVVMMNSDGGVDMIKIQSTINSCDSSTEEESPATPLPTQVIISEEWAQLIDCHKDRAQLIDCHKDRAQLIDCHKDHQGPASADTATKSECTTHDSLFTRTKREWDNFSGKLKAAEHACNQVEDRTDSVKGKREEANVSQSKIISSISGLGPSKNIGLRVEDPIEEANLSFKKKKVEGKFNDWQAGKGVYLIENGPNTVGKEDDPIVVTDLSEETGMNCSFQNICSFSHKKANIRNWKRMARSTKTVSEVQSRSSFFQKLQMVSTKGNNNLNGIDAFSSGKSKFSNVGKRSRLGKYNNSAHFVSKGRGTLSSSLKRWDIQFGKRKLVIGLGVENGVIKKGHIDVRIQMNDGFLWRFSGMYSDPTPSKRVFSWELLRRLRNVDMLPWDLASDPHLSWVDRIGLARRRGSLRLKNQRRVVCIRPILVRVVCLDPGAGQSAQGTEELVNLRENGGADLSPPPAMEDSGILWVLGGFEFGVDDDVGLVFIMIWVLAIGWVVPVV
ncbi:hypothetical protein QYF36_021822 [Acer negundo]|nr:hypothetical protein QYF36_021822 [Acer negundo]